MEAPGPDTVHSSPPAPFVTILVAAYNAEDTLPETLDSLLAQTDPSWEAVVVDDGSADATLTIAREFEAQDARFSVVTQVNAGTAAARNRAAVAASSDWLLPLDSDDAIEPTTVAELRAAVGRRPRFDLYSIGAWRLMPDGSREPWNPSVGQRATSGSLRLADMVQDNQLLATTLVRRSVFESIGGYRRVYVEDYDLFLRAMAKGAKHAGIPDRLFVYRVQRGSKNSQRILAARSTASVLRDLASDHDVPVPTSRLAEDRAAWWDAYAARIQLSEAMGSRQFRGRIRLYLAGRRAYQSRLKWLVALPLVAFAPQAIAARLASESSSLNA